MNRKNFLKATGILSISSLVSGNLFGQNEKPKTNNSEIKVKIVLKDEGTTLNFLGDKQLIKLAGKDTDEKLAQIYQEKPPKTHIPLHVHTKEDEIYNIIEGEIEFTVGGKTSLLKSGDTILLPRNIPHTWKVVGTTTAKVYLSIFPAGLEHMFEELNKLPAGPPDFAKIAAVCKPYGIQFM